MIRTLLTAIAVVTLAACQDNTPAAPLDVRDALRSASSEHRTNVQAERLGNPLVSEVMVVKRRHQLYNYAQPAADPSAFSGDLVAFVTGVAGRDAAYANTIAGALLPDMLVTYPKRDGTPTFWLSWVFGGYGGRTLQDDVVDIGLGALFGNLLGNNAGVSPGLTTDNVATNDVPFRTTFPYLAAAH